MVKKDSIVKTVLFCLVAVLFVAVITLSINSISLRREFKAAVALTSEGTKAVVSESLSTQEQTTWQITTQAITTTEETTDEGKLVRIGNDVGWIKMECPLCMCGEKLQKCPECKGTGRFKPLDQTHTSLCMNCLDGYLSCPLCDDNFRIVMKDYTRDPDIPTPAELVEQILALGEKPQYVKRCTHCDGGEKLDTCPTCSGSGNVAFKSEYGPGWMSTCTDCSGSGYVGCTYCNQGTITDEEFKTKVTRWNLKFEGIIDGVVDKSKSAEEIYHDYVVSQSMRDSLNLIIDGYYSSGSVSSSGSSNASSMCSRCSGLGTCSTCYGDGYMKNSYTGNQQKCSSCGGSGLCSKCSGKG